MTRVIVITGASSGIGAEMARQLAAKEGAGLALALAARNSAQREAMGTSALNEEGAMSVEECARLIIEGMNARRREVVMTAKGKLGRFIKLIAPGLVEKMALAALKKDVRPH